MSKSLVTLQQAKAQGGAFSLVGFHNSCHSYIMPTTHDNAEIKKPAYWANITKNVRAGDYIKIRKSDFSFIAEVYVRGVTQNYGLDVFVIYEHNLNQVKVVRTETANDFDIGFVPTHKFRIIRKSNRDILEKGFETKEDAEKFLENYLNGGQVKSL